MKASLSQYNVPGSNYYSYVQPYLILSILEHHHTMKACKRTQECIKLRQNSQNYFKRVRKGQNFAFSMLKSTPAWRKKVPHRWLWLISAMAETWFGCDWFYHLCRVQMNHYQTTTVLLAGVESRYTQIKYRAMCFYWKHPYSGTSFQISLLHGTKLAAFPLFVECQIKCHNSTSNRPERKWFFLKWKFDFDRDDNH